ncbi:MAG: 2-oxo acid dehydrogenase subunit E2 [Deltaproteobacteria bacterium]|nr:2-oxo acid dehydrogenase subunit E2 [Deltaproteobacteria bacterium]
MATVIEMPKLSDTMEEGGIANWLKKEGEQVEEGEPLVEIETDKSTIEYASPAEGILLKVLIKKGESSPLRSPIAVLGKKGESFDAALTNRQKPEAKGGITEERQETPKAMVMPNTKQETFAPSKRVKASPLAKKMATDKGLDLKLIAGSGPHGRIIARDLESLSVASPTVSTVSGDQKIPLTMMRKTIAKRLVAGKNEAPHFYLTISANMETVLKWRQELNDHPDVESGQLPKVSVNDLLILVTAKALRQHPSVNASWHGEHIMLHSAIHIAFAVALPSGLITPVIPNTDSLLAREIARQSKLLGEKAKKGELQAAEYTGGTFTISNLGMTGVESFTAIISPPQACILAVGKTQRVPHVAEDGSIIAQHRVKMTLSCDHRVVDGMVGARFLETLVSYLENPLFILS